MNLASLSFIYLLSRHQDNPQPFIFRGEKNSHALYTFHLSLRCFWKTLSTTSFLAQQERPA
jgi:hypothetical protein